jgi:DNA-binding MarR family transcriptional regulator
MARRSLLTSGAITQRLDKLERRGLVRRQVDRDDGRVVNVALTRRGRDVVDRIFIGLMEQEQSLLEPFTLHERAELASLLRRWLAWFEAQQSVRKRTHRRPKIKEGKGK